MKNAMKQVAATATAATAASLACGATLSVPVRRIATFHSNSLSELLFSLPALLALRESFPGAHLCTVLRPALGALLQDSHLVDEVVTRPKGGLSAQAALMAKLHARHFDMALSFAPSRNVTLLAWSTAAPVRAGFDSAKMDALLTHRVAKTGPNTIEASLELVRAVGCRTHRRDYNDLLRLDPQAHQTATALLEIHASGEPFIVVACEAERGERAKVKSETVESWAPTLDELAARWPLVLVGMRPVAGLAERLPQHFAQKRIVDLGGRTDLPALAAVCAQARLFVGSGGLMHLAAAMNTPVVGIFDDVEGGLAPCGVPHRLLPSRLGPGEVGQAARELIGL